MDQGQPAVETFAEFVWACAQLGYQHPDLTAHIGQVQDWYAAEDGLDLRALDADCAALAATADSAEQALRLQNDQLSALEQAWHGHGAQAAGELLDRHGGAARQAVAAVRRAADTLAPLRDQLWRAIDSKVAATERIEARCATQRPDWLAAARTVRTGLGDRAAASELIDAQVKPFVDNDIGADWVPAMRAASAAVADAYAAALAALADGPAPVFEIPGDLGPTWIPRIGAAVRTDPPTSSAATVPAGFTPSVGAGPAPGVSGPAPAGSSLMSPIPQIASAAPTLASPVDPAGPAVPSVPAATNPVAADPAAGFGSPLSGGLPGAGLSGMGSGVSGLGQQLADLFGGLIGSAGDGSAGTRADTALPGQLDPPDASDAFDELEDPDEPEDSDPEDPDDPDDDADDPDDPDDDAAAEDGEVTDAAVDDPTADEDSVDAPLLAEAAADDTADTAVEPEPAAAPAAAPVLPADPVEAPGGGTPCEIAADELPQVGG
ncbi:hypothetical protein [Mycolicibacterium setense]|uniref:hypothetical protein n=1 Tax=Mycolicibacterium setense TaxID=431269 RepID=UPI000B2828BD|nr:hypothetical protein [Mycolicibacterium setense]